VAKKKQASKRSRPTQQSRARGKAQASPPGNPTQRKASAVAPRSAGVRGWVAGARLRTLPLAVAPVALGTAAAIAASPDGVYHWVRALAALAVALLLQIGVNYANDYSDGIRGTDDHRVGPARLTASGLVEPRRVRDVAFACFGLAGLAGLFLVVTTQQWWLLAVGAVAILAAWFYTGGRRPYGYNALGEVFVFVFFGLVATAGTTYVQVLDVTSDTWLLAVAAGSFACAVLMVNNIRDIDQDRVAGKRTLAVVVGPFAARVLFTVFSLVPFVIAGGFTLINSTALFVFFVLLMVLPAILITWTARTAKELILALKLTSNAALAYALLLSYAVALPYFR